MNFKIKGNIELTHALKNYVQSKIVDKLEPFSSYIQSLTVKLISNSSKNIHTVEVLTDVKGRTSKRVNKVSLSNEDMYAAIDLIAEKVVRQIRKFKEKIDNKKYDTVSIEPPIVYEQDEKEYEIIKVKKFELLPMFVEEAIEQMNNLGHNFFFYLDASTGVPSVVYKRKDGNYGILES